MDSDHNSCSGVCGWRYFGNGARRPGLLDEVRIRFSGIFHRPSFKMEVDTMSEDEEIARLKDELEKLVGREVACRWNTKFFLSRWIGGPVVSKRSIRDDVVHMLRLAMAEIR